MYPDYRDDKTSRGPVQPPAYNTIPSASATPPDQQKYIMNTSDRERGGCLTIWLVLSFAAAGYAALMFLQILDYMRNPLVSQRFSGLVFMLVILIVVQVVSLVGIWNWKRWGVYGIVVMAIASPIVEIMFGIANASDCVAPFIQLGILYWLVTNNGKWEYFE